MTVAETELGMRFGLYVVGMFDILGQKRSLYELPGAPTPSTVQNEDVRTYVRATAGRVLQIRSLFHRHFEFAQKTVERIARSQGATVLQEQLFKPRLRHWGMSDSYVVAIPPPGHEEFSTVSTLVNVYRMLDVSAAVWLFAMREDLPIRGGIEFGIAVDIGKREVYGHALAEAVRLESKVAQYPRIVVGDGLQFLLNDAVETAAQRSAGEEYMANSLAELCWKCLGKDEDGQLVVDIVRGTSATQIREQMPDVLTAVTSNVQQQLQRHEGARDTKLVERYRWLRRRLPPLS